MKREEVVEYIKKELGGKVDIAIVLGTGFNSISDDIKFKKTISYSSIDDFPQSTVDGHKGEICFGYCGKKSIVCLSGRFHYYEGYTPEETVSGIKMLESLMVKNVILTNASGAINIAYNKGDLVVIKDHIKPNSLTPLSVRNSEERGEIYNRKLREKALSVKTSLKLQEGVYIYFSGPQFETPAEIRMGRIMGADCVGMSTVFEAIELYDKKIPFVALSLITNMASGVKEEKVTTSEVNETGKNKEEELKEYMKALIEILWILNTIMLIIFYQF